MRPLEKAKERIHLCNSKKRLPDYGNVKTRLEVAMKNANVSLLPSRMPGTPKATGGTPRITRNPSSSSGWSTFTFERDGNNEQDLNGFGPATATAAAAAVPSAPTHSTLKPTFTPQPVPPPPPPPPPPPSAPGDAGIPEEEEGW